MIFTSGTLSSLRGTVKGGGLAAAGGTGNQHHAMGLVDAVAKACQHVTGHAQLIEVEHATGLIEQAHHHRFTVLDGHGGQAYVDGTALHADVEVTVLGQALLGDVQARHQLQARYQCVGDTLFLYHLLMQHAIDTLADAQRRLIGLDVDVRGVHLRRVLEQRLQQFHHRCC